MNKISVFFLLIFSIINTNAQELKCLVTINSEQIPGSNKQVFTTLQQALTEYINQTKWTNIEVKQEEKIHCAMTIIITSRNNNSFEGSIQIQSTRPVYATSYETPILNIKDDAFSFDYNEFDPLIYNRNSFDSNLISTIVFYINIILGLDADTFQEYGGENFLEEAQNIMLQAQQSGLLAWSNQVGKQNRFSLIDNLLSSKLKSFRSVLYNYHRKGMDELFLNKQIAKQEIENNIISLEKLYNKSIGNYLIRLFFDAKRDELVNVYSSGPKTKSKEKLIQTLRRISPNNTAKWREIK